MTQPSSTSVPSALGRLRVALDDAFARASGELGLTVQQAELLCAARRPAAVGEVARTLRCDRSNVTRLADRAAKRGLVRRRSTAVDGRVTVLELSPKGRRLAERFVAALEAQLEALLVDWTDARERSAVDILNSIADALDGGRVSDPGRSGV